MQVYYVREVIKVMYYVYKCIMQSIMEFVREMDFLES